MNLHLLFVTGAALLVFQPLCHAGAHVLAERSSSGASFSFRSVPPPTVNDAASKAQFTLVDGERDSNGNSPAVLQDGMVPTGEDQPGANFFFRAGTEGGRIQIDLGQVIPVKQVNTYSWHTGDRAPQVYKLYGSDGAAPGFDPAPKRETDPVGSGWKAIATVDTRPQDAEAGGQHGVSVADTAGGNLGDFRYLLFDISRTEDRDPFGNSFYSEIDVIGATGPAPVPVTTAEVKPILISFESDDGKYHYTIDATAAADLKDWADRELRPVVLEWYPKLVALLPGDGFQPRTNLTLRFRNDMGGTPASAGGAGINLNSGWFRKELNREARGAVVHEMVHVVQSYGNSRRTNPNAKRTPGWLVEGLADYIRWFLYEPQTRGAEITARNLSRAKYDASYRVTGNFLNWVTRTYDPEIVPKLNTFSRKGEYSEQLWKEWTGKTVQELGDEWLKANQARLQSSGENSAEPASPEKTPR